MSLYEGRFEQMFPVLDAVSLNSAKRFASGEAVTFAPGVFAIGDVRANSTKRVGAAIGEGAAVVAQIHQVLAPAQTV